MSVFRVEKNKNYTTMSNYHLRDRNLTLKTKGLLSIMLSLPEDWDYSIKGLVSICKENETAVRSALRELETNGYLIREKKQTEKGLFDYDYTIYEEPQPYIGFPYTDDPYAENHIQLNTNKQNTEYKDKLDKQISTVTKNLIDKKFLSYEDIDLLEYDNFIEDMLSKNSYRDVITVINYVYSHMKEKDLSNKLAYFKTSVKNNMEKIKNIGVPKWFNEVIEKEEVSKEEELELENLFKEFKEARI